MKLSPIMGHSLQRDLFPAKRETGGEAITKQINKRELSTKNKLRGDKLMNNWCITHSRTYVTLLFSPHWHERVTAAYLAAELSRHV